MSWAITIPDGFVSSIEGYVNNFATSMGNFAPYIIMVGVPLLLVFVFWWTIRSWVSGIFTRKGR